MTNRALVVGIDGSDSALHAARWAAAEALARSARLRLICCDTQSALVVPEIPGVVLPQSFFDAVREQGENWLRQAHDTAAAVAPGVPIETEFVPRSAPAAVLIAESRTASLIAVGSRGLGGFTGLLVGSVAISVSAHASCSVAVIRGREQRTGDEPVVVGVDGSSESAVALRYAFETASREQVPLRAVHAWHSLSADEAWARRRVDGGWAIVQDDEERLLAESLAGWCERFPDVAVQRFVPLDKPARALLEHAESAQLVVVGARGRGAFTGLVLGSTSQHLVQRSPCPVAIAR
ncbi:universal stress protein [Saccharopolyspora gloriosae]|uniref:Nucleotide-binding universal stress UspA family protein n=1 Tax=Saccharopolyspora gloriosae TaxID=455344 RepID=A0A840NEI0_9PSEU|nr:universal stress protein [Saccharopolyspora gloriosae]MBB5070014.1 nucleotide-binding universal stress UspA family protein [Saccharopolyspora gloriosae]